MKKADRDNLKNTIEKATKGKWVNGSPKMISPGSGNAGSDYPIYEVDDSVGVYASKWGQYVQFATSPTFKWTCTEEERNVQNNLDYILAANPTAIHGLLETIDRLEAKLLIFKEALEEISNYFITCDPGRFGTSIGAGAIDVAKKALAEWDET